jgi:type II secretory pathway predicted ATPase ExeA
LSRALIDTLDERYRILLIINPRLTPHEFLRALALRLNIAEPARFKADLLEQIGAALFCCYEQGICPVLVVDEAQLVPNKETFDEIRLLTNFQLDDRNLICVVLIGQGELRQRLRHRAYEPLRQRIGMSYDLGPLDLEETMEYLDFRLVTAGGAPGLFNSGAAHLLHRYSGGVPRKINHAASLALLEGFGRESSQIDELVMEGVMLELEALPHG